MAYTNVSNQLCNIDTLKSVETYQSLDSEMILFAKSSRYNAKGLSSWVQW